MEPSHMLMGSADCKASGPAYRHGTASRQVEARALVSQLLNLHVGLDWLLPPCAQMSLVSALLWLSHVHWACQQMRVCLLSLKVSTSPEPAVLSLLVLAATLLILASLFLINTVTQHLLS